MSLISAVVVTESSMTAVALITAALKEALKRTLKVVFCFERLCIFVDSLHLLTDCSLVMTKWNEDLYVWLFDLWNDD